MNFTREPIIETIITPREGYRLIVRSTNMRMKKNLPLTPSKSSPSEMPFFIAAWKSPSLFFSPLAIIKSSKERKPRCRLKTPNLSAPSKSVAAVKPPSKKKQKQLTNSSFPTLLKKRATEESVPPQKQDQTVISVTAVATAAAEIEKSNTQQHPRRSNPPKKPPKNPCNSHLCSPHPSSAHPHLKIDPKV